MNIDGEQIEISCPKCRFLNYPTIKQIRLRDALICRGCKSKINFDDHMNSVRKVQRQLLRAFADLERSLSKAFKIKF